MDFLKSKIANRESFKNSYVDAVIEFNQSVKDWLNFEFKKVVYRYKAKFNAVVTNIDEDDVQFGYIEYKTVVIPFIAQYINSNNNRGHVFRLYFFDEYTPFLWRQTQFDYESMINKLIEEGHWRM